jgi:hypothetical protein
MDGLLWIGTIENGALHFIPDSAGKETWLHYTVGNG